MKIISLNLNGIRSATNKGLYTWLKKQDADVICLQEIKAQVNDMTTEMLNPEGYYGFFIMRRKKVTAVLVFIQKHSRIQLLKA